MFLLFWANCNKEFFGRKYKHKSKNLKLIIYFLNFKRKEKFKLVNVLLI